MELTRITKDTDLSTSDCFDFSRESIIDVVKKRRLQNCHIKVRGLIQTAFTNIYTVLYLDFVTGHVF